MNIYETRHTEGGQSYRAVMPVQHASDVALADAAATLLREYLNRRGLLTKRLSADALLDRVYRDLAGDS